VRRCRCYDLLVPGMVYRRIQLIPFLEVSTLGKLSPILHINSLSSKLQTGILTYSSPYLSLFLLTFFQTTDLNWNITRIYRKD